MVGVDLKIIWEMSVERTATVRLTKAPSDNWIIEHRAVWERKSGLREYYTTQIFNRMIPEIVDGPTLQLGTGAGHFSQYYPGMVNSDIADHDGVDVITDVHDLQFDDESFANIVGIDVLHHFARPGLALRECARVLRPGGRLVLVEPWAGPLGWFFFRFVHHEDCADTVNPWDDAFPETKIPMDGNAAIPITVLHKRASELRQHVPNFRILRTEPFGFLSVLLTGGFQKIGLPAPVIRICYIMENLMPRSVMAFIALRAMFVLEKQHS